MTSMLSINLFLYALVVYQANHIACMDVWTFLRRMSGDFLRCDNVEKMDDTLHNSIDTRPEEYEYFGGDMLNFPLTSRRTYLKLEDRLWPGGIVPFVVAEDLLQHPDKVQIIMDSMQHISNLTDHCVQFFELYEGEPKKYNVPNLIITGESEGCSSDVGRADTTPKLNLSPNSCFKGRGHILHELLHALGQIHEQMRPDRDKYVKIVWNNIIPDRKNNFKIYSTEDANTFDLPYDYDSITHYSAMAFSVDRKNKATIVPIGKQQKIGQRNDLSEIDIKKLKSAYKCEEKRPKIKTIEELQALYSEKGEIHDNDK